MIRLSPSKLKRAFTLVELLVAMLIAAIVFSSLLAVFWRGAKFSRDAQSYAEAARVASSVVDALDRGLEGSNNPNDIIGRENTHPDYTVSLPTPPDFLTNKDLEYNEKEDNNGVNDQDYAKEIDSDIKGVDVANSHLDMVWLVEINKHPDANIKLNIITIAVARDSNGNGDFDYEYRDNKCVYLENDVLSVFTTLLADGKRGQ